MDEIDINQINHKSKRPNITDFGQLNSEQASMKMIYSVQG